MYNSVGHLIMKVKKKGKKVSYTKQGLIVKKLKTTSGLTIRRFAELIGITHGHVTFLQQGKVKVMPQVAIKLKYLAEELGLNITLDDLFADFKSDKTSFIKKYHHIAQIPHDD